MTAMVLRSPKSDFCSNCSNGPLALSQWTSLAEVITETIHTITRVSPSLGRGGLGLNFGLGLAANHDQQR